MNFAERIMELAKENVRNGGRPFVSSKWGIVVESSNLVAQIHDPTAHAEILAVRTALPTTKQPINMQKRSVTLRKRLISSRILIANLSSMVEEGI
ncbi:hypothetical protein K7432_004014 [Basidiobolus ranarum]|uniref:CMP/dCMP-type deaminase domain-containing protein n=1 Tax=Basidiobolus ranarum TaxID=34480 RepID=A0ABR2WYU9_9FUNG